MNHCEQCGSDKKIYLLLKRLEWSRIYSYCTGWPCCPICRGIKPGHGYCCGKYPDNSGHSPDCELDKAILKGGKDDLETT